MCATSVFRLADVLEIRVSAPGDALDRFEAAWNRVAEGRGFRPFRILSFHDLAGLLKTLSPARWQLLERLGTDGPSSVYRLAKRLQRDYKNVHTDVAALAKLGLIERRSRSEIALSWDAVRAEL